MIGRPEKTVVDGPGAPETGHRVFEDPAGHPFCLVHGRPVPDPRFVRQRLAPT